MAITISKQPSGIYPAYNDSYIQFSSDLAGNNRAEITLTPSGLFPHSFLVYPDLDGVYTFNLREAVQIILNENGFNDPAPSAPSGWAESFPYGYVNIATGQTNDITIEVFNNSTSESVTPSYEFIRGIKQLGEEVFVNEAQLLNYSTNGVDYNLTYWEGYPFTFELQRLTTADSVVFNNLNSGDSSTAVLAASTGSFRAWVDKGSSNWTTGGFLPLSDTINRIEVEVNSTFKTNVRIKKVSERGGVYLKWFNNDGGYSYWLFDEYRREEIRSSDVGLAATNKFLNVGDANRVARSRTLGRSAVKQIRVKTVVDENEAKLLESLFYSPSVQMYSSNTPYVAGEWVDVSISSNFVFANKRRLNEVSVTIVTDDTITARL